LFTPLQLVVVAMVEVQLARQVAAQAALLGVGLSQLLVAWLVHKMDIHATEM
jgi:hypothetical protein